MADISLFYKHGSFFWGFIPFDFYRSVYFRFESGISLPVSYLAQFCIHFFDFNILRRATFQMVATVHINIPARTNWVGAIAISVPFT